MPETLILGSGRFIRAVLVPPLLTVPNNDIHVFQPRGTSFCQSLSAKGKRKSDEFYLNDVTYEVDTINFDNHMTTETVGEQRANE